MTCPHSPPPRRRPAAPPPPRARRKGAILALLALLALVLVVGAVTPARDDGAAPAHDDLAELVDGGSGLVDVHHVAPGELRAGSAIPTRPDPEWAQPPCPPTHMQLNGACWLLAASSPPCPVGSYEHGARCYTPLPRGRRPPTSVDR